MNIANKCYKLHDQSARLIAKSSFYENCKFSSLKIIFNRIKITAAPLPVIYVKNESANAQLFGNVGIFLPGAAFYPG